MKGEVGKVSESNRAFDVEFWQRQGSMAIFAAAWQMVVDAHRWKKKSDAELELQRSVEHVGSLKEKFSCADSEVI